VAKRLDASICHLMAYGGRPQHRRLYVRYGDPAPLPKKGRNPQFLAHVHLAKRLHGSRCHLLRVGIGLRDIVLHGDPNSPSSKEAQPPIFSQCPLWPNGWMDYNATWYGGRPQPRRLCVRWRPSYPQEKGTPTPPNFGPCLL